ncbi:MAG: NAD(P)-binding domain-containing protein [Gammaproteobacteria bacterium]|nr:NAD(P)-binding domain-containing protein [Gammaproteobacteria bacterium]MDP2140540.1 NAD(P)-binding domain-containing protein [Gammaproteobacteria bacterium]MDP2347309.1 NAD(P)-binding domain-containing protein [Gammaproteobacteria bacterium]
MSVRKTFTRRELNKLFLIGAASSTFLGVSGITTMAQEPLRIGIIGSGQIGGAVGKRWAEAGHQILFSSRNPDELAPLVAEAGPNARAGTVAEAAQFGDIVLIAVPYGAMPQVGADNAQYLQGKIVIDCANPRADRDGPMADEAIAKGTGVASAEFFPGTRLVRAFNAVSFAMVEEQHHREGELIGIPVAGDDAEAVAITERLVRDAGFDPVFVGPLSSARRFDRGTDVYVRGMTAAELRQALNL